MMLPLYRLLTSLGSPLIDYYLGRRKARGKEHPTRFSERFGHPGRDRPGGPLVWIHAASVGESISVLPLIDRLLERSPDLHVLVTTGTVTSADLLAKRLPARAFHQFVPVDRLSYVRRFLDHWQPDLGLWTESEFWPNLLSETSNRGTPLILINGRISAKSFKGWQRSRGLIGKLLSGFTLCLGQTEEDAGRLRHLGAPRAVCHGNLKFAAPPLPADAGELQALTGVLTGRPRWLAASTHAGEEQAAGRIHKTLASNHPGLLTIIVPRHPDRGTAIVRELRGAGLNIAHRSAGETVEADTDVYVADTLGELGLFYRLADVVFMGKSLVPLGGQNPLEAARLERPLLYGPHMGNFEEMVDRLKAAGASESVEDEAALATALDSLLSDADERSRRGGAARQTAEAEAGVLDAIMGELEPFLRELENNEGA